MGTTEVTSVLVTSVLGLSKGIVVQELGWDTDVDESLREAVMEAIDADLLEEAVEAVDAVLLWWRAEDGDIADGLVDSLTDLSKTGSIWLLTPKVGRAGHVEPRDIAEAVQTAGLALTTPANISEGWSVMKIVRPKGARR